MSRSAIAGLVLLGTLLAGAPTALARTQQDLAYPSERVWNAAVRLLRLDLGCTITERDVEVGYVIFEYREGGRSYPGSVELLRISTEETQDATRVFVSIPAMPRYVEIMIADRLARKMVEEFGEPVRRPRAQPGGQRPTGGGRQDGRQEGDGGRAGRDGTGGGSSSGSGSAAGSGSRGRSGTTRSGSTRSGSTRRTGSGWAVGGPR